MEIVDLIRILLKRKFQLLISVISVFLVSFFIYNTYPREHIAALIFFVKPSIPYTVLRGSMVEIYSGGADRDRVYRILVSDSLKSKLVRKFKLNAYYQFDTEKNNGFEKACSYLQSKYSVVLEKDYYTIKLYDKDPEMALNLLKELLTITDEIYKKLYLETVQDDITLHKEYLKTVSDEFNLLQKNMGIDWKQDTINIKQFTLKSEMEFLTKELVHLELRYRKILIEFKKNKYGSFEIIKEPKVVVTVEKNFYESIINKCTVPFVITLIYLMIHIFLIVSFKHNKNA